MMTETATGRTFDKHAGRESPFLLIFDNPICLLLFMYSQNLHYKLSIWKYRQCKFEFTNIKLDNILLKKREHRPNEFLDQHFTVQYIIASNVNNSESTIASKA